MKYFYDTEFNEDGYTIDFISIGIVAEDGREYYGVSNEFDTRRVASNTWLMNNVMSSIKHEAFVVQDFEGKLFVRDLYVTDPKAKSRQALREEIIDFVGDDTPEWWAWYGSYDHVALMQLLWGKMIAQPPHWPFTTYDIAMLRRAAAARIGIAEHDLVMPRQVNGKHNALDDAKFNVIRYEFLEGIMRWPSSQNAFDDIIEA